MTPLETQTTLTALDGKTFLQRRSRQRSRRASLVDQLNADLLTFKNDPSAVKQLLNTDEQAVKSDQETYRSSDGPPSGDRPG
jgi:hypothetical protein